MSDGGSISDIRKRTRTEEADDPVSVFLSGNDLLISEGMWSARMYGFQTHIFSGAEEMYMPRLAYLNRSPQKTVHEFFIEQSYLFLPTAGYAMEHRREEFTAEDQETVAQILEAQAKR